MLQRAAPTIRELLSYRLHRVANLLSRGAELRYRREFGVSLWEWRTVALLGAADGALSPGELARAAGVDKSQMSRVVAGLSRRGIVLRAGDKSDARGVKLRLSARGRRLYEGLIRAAAERNAALLACLGTRERACFERTLEKLAAQARRLIEEEKAK
jgi:DNA-binding MarR family transcriptional regulator